MTKEQKRLIRDHQYATVIFDSGMKDEVGTIGYCIKGKVHYEIHLDKSIRKDKPFLNSVLLHELGHLECEHLEIVNSEAEVLVKEAFERYEKRNNIPEEERKSTFEGFGDLAKKVLNIAADLEVNSKFLTFENVKHMTEKGFEPITLKRFNATYKDSWDLYLDDVVNEMYDNIQVVNVIMDIPDCKNTQQGKGNGGSSKQSKSGKGNSQKDKNDSGEQKSLSDALRESDKNFDKEMSEGDELDKEDDHESSNGRGTGLANATITHSSAEALKEMTDLLMSLRTVKRGKQLDSMRLYNRGTRRNDSGILYSSVRRKIKKDSEKIGILVDISGSMDTSSIRKAIKSMSEVAPKLNHQTVVKTWGSVKSEEFNINEIPEHIREGGGTYLPAGLKEFIDEGFRTVVIYSDFEDILGDYVKVLNSDPCKLYLLCVGNMRQLKGDKYWEQMVSMAVRVIYME